MSPSRRRDAVSFLQRRHRVWERRACQVVSQHRSTNRHQPVPEAFERRLVKRLHELAAAHPQERYKTTWRRLRWVGWPVNHKRIWRLWRQEGLKQPVKQASGKHADGVAENAMCTVERSIGSTRVERVLTDLFTHTRRKPQILRSDNGPEFSSAKLTAWLGDKGVERAFVAKGRPNQNGIVERLNGLMRRHVLDAEDLHTLLEAGSPCRCHQAGSPSTVTSALTGRSMGSLPTIHQSPTHELVQPPGAGQYAREDHPDGHTTGGTERA